MAAIVAGFARFLEVTWRVVRPTIAPIILPICLTAITLGVPRIRDALNRGLDMNVGSDVAHNHGDFLVAIQICLCWFLVIQLMILPVLFPQPVPRIMMGKLTFMTVGDMPRVYFHVVMYILLPIMAIRLNMSMIHKMKGVVVKKPFVMETIGFTMGYLLSVLLIRLMTPAELLVSVLFGLICMLIVTGSEVIQGPDKVEMQLFMFFLFVIMSTIVFLILNDASPSYHEYIHKKLNDDIFGPTGQGSGWDMFLSVVFLYGLPLGMGIASAMTTVEKRGKKKKNATTASHDSSLELGIVMGVLLGLFLMMCMPDKLRPTTLLHRVTSMKFPGMSPQAKSVFGNLFAVKRA